MPKLFKNICAEFDQYNPEDDFTHLEDGETFDEDGLLHSFDDLPSQVSSSEYEGNRFFLWHSHGKLFRGNDKPVSITYGDNAYSTINANHSFQSYGGKPSRIAYDKNNKMIFASFYKEDGLHRENGLPAQLIFHKTGCLETKFYENNRMHRDGGLPALFTGLEELDGTKQWVIKGYKHREDGPAILYPTTASNRDKWFLFDIQVSETQFAAVKNVQKEKDIPLWLAFLSILKIVEEVQMNFFLESNLHNELSLEWSLKSLGVTDELFKQSIIELRKTQDINYETVKTLTALIAITKFYEQKKES